MVVFPRLFAISLVLYMPLFAVTLFWIGFMPVSS